MVQSKTCLINIIWDRHNMFKGRSPIILREEAWEGGCTSLLMIEIEDLGWQKTTYKFKKVVSEEILRRVRRYSSANKDIPFKTPLFIYSVTTPFFCITTTLKQHENTGNNDQVVKWKSFNEISIIRWSVHVIIFYFEWIL